MRTIDGLIEASIQRERVGAVSEAIKAHVQGSSRKILTMRTTTIRGHSMEFKGQRGDT